MTEAGSEVTGLRPGPGGVWWAESGSAGGPLVVLVHGSMDRATGFAKVVRLLEPWARVARYDRRGYAHSLHAPGPATIERHAGDLLSVLAGRPGVLVGHSYGALVVMAAATRRPELARSLVIYEAPLPWLDWWHSHTARSTAAPEDLAEAFMRRMVGDRVWERLPPRTRAERRAEGVALKEEIDSVARGCPFDPAVLTMPALVVTGTASPERFRRSGELIRAMLPQAVAVPIEGAAHRAQTTHPEPFAEVVRRAAEAAVAAGR